MNSEEEAGPRKRAGERKRQRTREAIVSATLDLYAGLKVGDFGRDQITAEAGIGTATLYNHFNTMYEVLRAAHEKLLAPIIEPVLAGEKAGTYNPTDGLAELVRYVYGVAKISNDNHALTTAMIRSYFDGPLGVTGTPERDYPELGDVIASGLIPIVRLDPFVPTFKDYLRTEDGGYEVGVSSHYLARYASSLLLDLYQFSHEEYEWAATYNLLVMLLPFIHPKPGELEDKIGNGISRRVGRRPSPSV